MNFVLAAVYAICPLKPKPISSHTSNSRIGKSKTVSKSGESQSKKKMATMDDLRSSYSDKDNSVNNNCVDLLECMGSDRNQVSFNCRCLCRI